MLFRSNVNLGSLLEQAITGDVQVDVSLASATLTALNGASDQSRNMIITAVGTPSGPTSIYCPNGVSKVYVFVNKTLQPVTFSTVSGTGVAVAAGNSAFLYCDGTNVNACTIPTYTPNSALITNSAGYAQASSVTSTQIGYLSDVTSNIGAGKVKVMAMLDPRRHPRLPEVPAIQEVLPQYRKAPNWIGMFGPAKLPQAIVARLNTEMNRALRSEEHTSELQSH